MKKVMAFGTFSLLHPGHSDYLEQSKMLGDHLIVVLTSDVNVRKEKGRNPIFNQDERHKLVSSLKVVDKVIIGDDEDFFKVIREEKPDILALGYDAKCKEHELKQKLEKMKISAEVIRMKRKSNHETQRIIERLKRE